LFHLLAVTAVMVLQHQFLVHLLHTQVAAVDHIIVLAQAAQVAVVTVLMIHRMVHQELLTQVLAVVVDQVVSRQAMVALVLL
jgi:hypothetical protein